ncbi:MAG: isoprenyl transferase [Bacteroidaceae bacterium]|nr:isoprenyl transferase [Bacteroidaceae bacterium]
MELDLNNIPHHIAIIMDGNGRWAKQRGLPRTAGHAEGVEAVKRITEECVRLGVKFLTLYTFSTENWNRPTDEVSALMGLVLANLEEEIFMKNNVRFQVIGDTKRLPENVQQRLWQVMEHTADNDSMTMVVALSYSSRWEITKAVRDIVWEMKKTSLTRATIDPDEITEDTVAQHLETYFMPDPDLLIRTGGEQRISNYLLWQIAYTELYFCDTFWPDFDENALHHAIADFQQRERRYGKTSEQIKSLNPAPTTTGKGSGNTDIE